MEELTAYRWGSDAPGRPWLDFTPDRRVVGSDGCNRLAGPWQPSAVGVALGPLVSTMMYCQGVDTWLAGARAARLLGDRLQVLDADGAVIGELPRDRPGDSPRSTTAC
jgi:heat shock protein HslJ